LLADLQQRLPSLLGRSDVRVQAAPCVGRCDQAPAVQVGQWPLGHATTDSVAALSAQAPKILNKNGPYRFLCNGL
jgi:NADH:ubiquinone oxidoreductase subunit E